MRETVDFLGDTGNSFFVQIEHDFHPKNKIIFNEPTNTVSRLNIWYFSNILSRSGISHIRAHRRNISGNMATPVHNTIIIYAKLLVIS